jgi:hypothetical protein
VKDLPRFVHAQTTKGRTYYYFNASHDPYGRRYVRLPDIADPAFEAAVCDLAAQRPTRDVPKGTPRPGRAPRLSYVYFIGGETGSIKIGHTINPETRLARLQTGSPIKLQVLGTVMGGQETEREYHNRFRHLRLDGEWFERTPEILEEIRRLNAFENFIEHIEPVQNAFQNGLEA